MNGLTGIGPRTARPRSRKGWKPESGFFHYRWQATTSALLYVLGLAFSQPPPAPTSYAAWTRRYQWERIYGSDILYAGSALHPSFSHAWNRFSEIRIIMREKGSAISKTAAARLTSQREYARSTQTIRIIWSECWFVSG